MKKLVFSLILVAVIALAMGSAQAAFAQAPVPPTGSNPGAGYGAGMMNGRGFRGGMSGMSANGGQIGLLHDELVAAYADRFGLNVDKLKARLAEGETLAQIAFAQGFTTDEFIALKVEARALALDQAVANGDLTQEQADWMKTRGMGRSDGQGRGGRAFANPDCPYYPQSNP